MEIDVLYTTVNFWVRSSKKNSDYSRLFLKFGSKLIFRLFLNDSHKNLKYGRKGCHVESVLNFGPYKFRLWLVRTNNLQSFEFLWRHWWSLRRYLGNRFLTRLVCVKKYSQHPTYRLNLQNIFKDQCERFTTLQKDIAKESYRTRTWKN